MAVDLDLDEAVAGVEKPRMKDPGLLASFPRKSFIPASNSDYQPIVDVAKKIKLID